MARNVKEFEDYLIENPHGVVPLSNYEKSPATAFLNFVCLAKDASIQCTSKFKNGRNSYTQDALDSMYIINGGLLASIMGNFETFEKYMFAGMFELSVYLKKFNLEKFLKDIKKASKQDANTKFEMDFSRVAGYRDSKVSIGLLLGDQLKNWQSPTIVSSYFGAFNLKSSNGQPKTIFSNDDKERLSVLWQMRHSIVHTASTITLPDSQKIGKLSSFGGKVISLDKQFINEVARKFHPIIKDATSLLKDCFEYNLRSDLTSDVSNRVANLFEVSSPCSTWL